MTEREQHRNWVEEAALGEARREIRRLRRALMKVTAADFYCDIGTNPHCECPRCLATRALKGKP